MQVKPALGLFHSHQVPRENGRVFQHGVRRRPSSPTTPRLPYPKSLSEGEGCMGEINPFRFLGPEEKRRRAGDRAAQVTRRSLGLGAAEWAAVGDAAQSRPA